jgi:hypothetical protein
VAWLVAWLVVWVVVRVVVCLLCPPSYSIRRIQCMRAAVRQFVHYCYAVVQCTTKDTTACCCLSA